MAGLAIGSLFEFGKADGVLRKACGMDSAASTTSSQAPGPGSVRSDPSRPTSWSTDGGASVAASASSARAQPWIADQAAAAAAPKTSDQRMDEDRDDDPSHLSRPMQALSTNTTAALVMDSPRAKQAQLVFTLSMEVAFTTLGYLIKTKPYMPAQSPYVKAPLNPYITVLLTFIATIFKYPAVVPLMERAIPWGALADILGTALRRSGGPRDASSGPAASGAGSKDAPLFSASQILPEDWSLRGMEWSNRRVYERGFWLKAHKGPLGSVVQGEMDVIVPSNTIMSPSFAGGAGISGSNLLAAAMADGLDGVVEEDDDDEDANGMDVDDDHRRSRKGRGAGLSPAEALGVVRWKRLRSSAEMLVRTVPGFRWDPSSLSALIVEDLADKIALWEQERLDAEEERAKVQTRQQELQAQMMQRHRRASSNEMEVDEDGFETFLADEGGEDVGDDDEDDPEDSEQVRELKVNLLPSQV